MVGGQSLVDADMIPQKHRVLESVERVEGAPVAPVFKVELGTLLFKQKFKEYYAKVLAKAKKLRKCLA